MGLLKFGSFLNEDNLGMFTTSKGLKVHVYDEMLDYHSGQSYCKLTAYDEKDEEVIGWLDYSIYKNVIDVDFIKTKVQRQGVGTLLMNTLKDTNKGKKINYGLTTEEGTPFIKSLK